MNTATILFAEDNENFGMVLKSYLEVNQLVVEWAKTGSTAMELINQKIYDLYILDVMLPEMDGFALANHLQRKKVNKPFLFLTGRALKEDQVRGFKLGAVDYLIKPFDPEILLYKIKALLHTSYDQKNNQELAIGGFFLNPVERKLTHEKGTVMTLSPKESKLLQLLIERQGEVLSRNEALQTIWNANDYFSTQSMNVYITKLRKYLRTDDQYTITIENIRGTGFKLMVSDS